MGSQTWRESPNSLGSMTGSPDGWSPDRGSPDRGFPDWESPDGYTMLAQGLQRLSQGFSKAFTGPGCPKTGGGPRLGDSQTRGSWNKTGDPQTGCPPDQGVPRLGVPRHGVLRLGVARPGVARPGVTRL